MTYDEFRDQWYKTHPNSIPERPKNVNSIFKIGLWFIVYFGSAILSGAHSIPAIAKTIPVSEGLITQGAANTIALSGFLFVELTLFVNALHKGEGWVSKITTITALGTAIVANIYSSIVALGTNDAGASGINMLFLIFVALVIGISAPLTALLSGERIHALEVENEAANEETRTEYTERMRQIDATINAAYTRYLNERPAVQSLQPVESNGQGSNLGQSEVEQILRDNPDIWDALIHKTTPARDLAAYIGTSPATLSKAKGALLNGQ